MIHGKENGIGRTAAGLQTDFCASLRNYAISSAVFPIRLTDEIEQRKAKDRKMAHVKPLN